MSPLVQEQKDINNQLKSLTKTVNDLKGCVIDTKKTCELNSTAASLPLLFDNENVYGIKLPCEELTDFEKFDSYLKSDDNFRTQIVNILYHFFIHFYLRNFIMKYFLSDP